MDEQGLYAVHIAQINQVEAGPSRGGQVTQELVTPTRVAVIDDIEKDGGHDFSELFLVL